MQGAFFLAAFGARDFAWLHYLSGQLLAPWGATWGTGSPGDFLLYDVCFLLFLVLLAYGFLRYQVFDIDLKVKLALDKGTLGAVFVAVFFVVAKLAESLADQLFSGFGWVVGAVAAGLMLFALRPLERLATRVADSAMPKTQDTPAYAQFRKLEVYKATLESFLVDGAVTPRERDALSRLAAKLGIAAADARSIEADVGA